MPLIGPYNPMQLPSLWAEARSMGTLHNERTNIPQVITRSEANAISYNSTGPLRRNLHQVPQQDFKAVDKPMEIKRHMPLTTRQNYSALAQNVANYHPYDYLNTSNHYNNIGREAYTPNPNPVIIDKVI